MTAEGWTPELHPSRDEAAAADFLGQEMERRNCELRDSFGFCERDEIIQARYGYGGTSEAAIARREARRAANVLRHKADRLTRLEREGGQARRWATDTAASLRRAGEHRAAELVEARARYFDSVRANDPRS